VQDHVDALGLVGKGRERLRDRVLGAVPITQMDHQGLACPPGDRNLRGERPTLILGVGPIPVEVEAGLPDGHDAVARAELLQRIRGRAVEAVGAVRMPPHRREDRLVLLRGSHGARIRFLPQAHGEYAVHSRPPSRVHQLGLCRLAEPEVRVRIDHAASLRGAYGPRFAWMKPR
jgi:hypothetical protein